MKLEKTFERMQKVMSDYNESLEVIDNKQQEVKSQLDDGSLSKNFYDEKMEGLDNEKVQKQSVYSKKLDKVYNTAQEEIKARVSYGEGDPATTAGVISQADSLDKTELKIVVDRFKDQENYLGLQGIKKVAADKNIHFSFDTVQKQLDELDRNYSGKNQILTSNKPSTRIDNMRTIAGIK
jgi:hypothetical protein